MNWPTRIVLVILAAVLIVVPMRTDSHGATASTNPTGLVVAVGDSIVQGVGTSDPDHLSWPARIGAVRTGRAGGCVITACWGQRPMVDQFADTVLALHPDAVVIALGINDIAAGRTPLDIANGLSDIVYQARLSGAQVYVQTLIPLGPARWNWELDRQALNNLIRARFPHVIDMDPMMMHPKNGTLRWAFDSGDNLHPNSHGYRMMAAMARDALLNP